MAVVVAREAGSCGLVERVEGEMEMTLSERVEALERRVAGLEASLPAGWRYYPPLNDTRNPEPVGNSPHCDWPDLTK